jgi:hypothetical protein
MRLTVEKQGRRAAFILPTFIQSLFKDEANRAEMHLC